MHGKRVSTSELIERHSEDRRYRTDVSADSIEADLELRQTGPLKHGIFAPSDAYRFGGCVGRVSFKDFDLVDFSSARVSRQSPGSEYHVWDLIVGELPDAIQHTTIRGDECSLPGWTELFDCGGWTDLDADRFPVSNWGELDSVYTSQPDYASSAAQDSVDAPDGQAELNDFDCDVGPCAYGEVRGCSCCRCPEGHKSIRARQNKEPTYCCNSPNCDWSGDSPAVFPARR